MIVLGIIIAAYTLAFMYLVGRHYVEPVLDWIVNWLDDLEDHWR